MLIDTMCMSALCWLLLLLDILLSQLLHFRTQNMNNFICRFLHHDVISFFDRMILVI